MLYICTVLEKMSNNEQQFSTYSSTRYYYSLAKQAEVSLVCS